MTWTVQIDPPSITSGRALLDLNSGPIQVHQAGIDWGQAAITTYMADEQIFGAVPISYRVPNRIVTLPLFIGADSSDPELAKTHLEQKVALIQREKGFLYRRRTDASGAAVGPAMYADIMSATLTIPDTWMETGKIEDQVSLVLECLPDFYGDQIILDTINGTGSIKTVLQQGAAQAVILGDHPGRAQVSIANNATDKRGLLWGFRSRHYDAGAPLKPAVSGSGSSIPSAVFATYTGSHVGSYQVWALISGDTGATVQAAWGMGDSTAGFRNPEVAILGAGSFLVSLGQVQLDRVPLGAQTWVLQLLVRNGAASVSEVYLQPLDEAAGQLRGSVADPVMVNSGNLSHRYDSAFRTIAGGTAYRPVASVIGDLLRIPPSGAEGRPVEMLIRPTQGDLTTAIADASTTDTFSATVTYRPSYLFRP